ncbi:putative NADH dehydrogenase [ubiquinone] 1 alpha subcomplex subunit 11 [Trichinella spiralis]|uniref:putative NADH dehydrogenase [ubiquinone] 1 alpha subcomplex subunit 11 n=1 Tax=Trichinella spiralis TaxID=6334 RepID=UPI0001EFB7D1|nr:putative NADH dehydrogenase [ubiquinone] 1 alpha subcomplex subunit 11 [Trichinella spiralis]
MRAGVHIVCRHVCTHVRYACLYVWHLPTGCSRKSNCSAAARLLNYIHSVALLTPGSLLRGRAHSWRYTRQLSRVSDVVPVKTCPSTNIYTSFQERWRRKQPLSEGC